MAALLDQLKQHCEHGVLTPFEYGVCDCTLWAADWVQIVTGRDVAADWRGTYRTALGYRRKVKRAGGLEAVVTAALSDLAGYRAEAPHGAPCGAIGLVETRLGPACAIRLQSERWAAKTAAGLWFVPNAITAWSFQCQWQSL
jgi:hypothetical protein